MSMQVVIQSKKLIKPATPTPETLCQHKISLIDELAPALTSSVVLFFSAINKSDQQNPAKFVANLEKSLEKTLPSFYPLAGRYLQELHVVECKDQGVEFIEAKANNIKLQDVIVESETDVSLVDDLIPFALGAVDQVTDPILGIQATTFECGGLALGVSISHRIADASTLCTFLNSWAATSRQVQENRIVNKACSFNSPTFFPGRGIPPVGQGYPRSKISCTDDDDKLTTKKLSFSDSDISRLKSKMGLHAQNWSKVQLVSAVIWNALIEIDQRSSTTDDHPRDSILIRPINLRRNDVSLIPKETCGNLHAILWTEWKNTTTTNVTTEALGDLLRANVRDFVDSYLEAVSHDDMEKVQTMVMNSFLSSGGSTKAAAAAAGAAPSNMIIGIISWCNFPFYEADYGFGKPVWVSRGTIKVPLKNTVQLLDGIGGNGVDAYVAMEHEHVPLLQQAVRRIEDDDFVAYN